MLLLGSPGAYAIISPTSWLHLSVFQLEELKLPCQTLQGISLSENNLVVKRLDIQLNCGDDHSEIPLSLERVRIQLKQLLQFELPMEIDWRIDRLVLHHPDLPDWSLQARGKLYNDRFNMLLTLNQQGWIAVELDRLSPRLKFEMSVDIEPLLTQSPFWSQLEMTLLEPVMIQGDGEWAFMQSESMDSNWSLQQIPVQTPLGLRIFPSARITGQSKWLSDQLDHQLFFESGDFQLKGKVEQGLVERGYRFRMQSDKLGELSQRFVDWLPPRLNLIEGSLDVAGDWGLEQSHIELKLQKLLGHFNDIVLADGSLKVRLVDRAQQPPELDYANLSIGVLDVGIPVKNIDVSISGNRIELFHGEILNGQFRLHPMAMNVGEIGILYVDGIDLQELLQHYELQAVDATGVLDGDIPFIIESTGVLVEEGKLQARKPGGYIALTQLDSMQGAMNENPALKLAMNVLREVDYSRMACDFSYQPDGNLLARISIEGESRSADHRQPINLNYQHEENVLQLLRSLRFSSDIQQTMERWADAQGKSE